MSLSRVESAVREELVGVESGPLRDRGRRMTGAVALHDRVADRIAGPVGNVGAPEHHRVLDVGIGRTKSWFDTAPDRADRVVVEGMRPWRAHRGVERVSEPLRAA